MLPDEVTFVRETCAKVRWPHMWSATHKRRIPAVNWADWIRTHGAQVDEWLREGKCLVYAQGDVALGFLVASGGVLRMLYVKRRFRGNGFGLNLLNAWRRITPADPVQLYRPTASIEAWCKFHGIPWRQVNT